MNLTCSVVLAFLRNVVAPGLLIGGLVALAVWLGLVMRTRE